MKFRPYALFALLAVFSCLGGCSLVAPKYTLSVNHVQALRDAGVSPANVGTVSAQGEEAHDQSIGLRGSGMHSPYGSYAKYLQEALTQELREAKVLDPNAHVEISAVLLKNDIHAAGFVTASADIEARFQVTRAGQTTFDKVKTAHIEWGSNFIGSIAIARAQQHYPQAVAALLEQLYADREFLQALKP
jgi:hypothetical protein